jgi:hypothetical protein
MHSTDIPTESKVHSQTWPVTVEGDQMVPATDEPTISAYGDPETANERLATPLLHRLCALLSLALGGGLAGP